jgi:hypothetical protein
MSTGEDAVPADSIRQRLKLGLGKLRRFYLHTLHRDYIRRNHARRKGECIRCGACCELMFTCPHLTRAEEGAACVRHDVRMMNCRVFPIDERDLSDRDAVANGRACGYHFDPPMPPQRWLALLLAAGLAALAWGSPAHAKDQLPRRVTTSFRDGRMPHGWAAESGEWTAREGGMLCTSPGTIAGALNEHRLPVADVDVRIGVRGEFLPHADYERAPPAAIAHRTSDQTARRGPGRPPLLIQWGPLRAGMHAPDPRALFARFGPTGQTYEVDGIDRRLRFRARLALAGGEARLRVGSDCIAFARDVFGAAAAERVDVVRISASPGTLIRAVSVELTARRTDDAATAAGDAAYRSGDMRGAAAEYARVRESARRRGTRAQAAYKLGESHARSGQLRRAAEAWDAAQRADPHGPWGERARASLARASLDEGKPSLALGFLSDLVRSTAPRTEDWETVIELADLAARALVAEGAASGATHPLRRMAEQAEWAGSARGAVARLWALVARSFEIRGWPEEARALRARIAKRYGRHAVLLPTPSGS